LGYHHLVNGRVRLSHAGGDEFAGLGQEAQGMGQSALFSGGSVDCGFCVMCVVDDGGGDARTIFHCAYL